jgi:hypothetical protein
VSRAPVLALFIAVLGSTQAGAQQRPDFSGEWSTPPEAVPAGRGAGAARGNMGSGWGPQVTLAQTMNRLTVQYVFFSTYDLQPPISQVFALDGSETRNDVMIGHATMERRSRAAWRGDTLVLTTASSAPDPAGGPSRSTEMQQALFLAAPDTLIVQTTRPGPTGPPDVSRTVYTKG